MASHLKDAEEEAKSDMTPMIDAVFLLIIFFLCIDFKVLEAKLPAYLPKDKGSQATQEEPQEQLSLKIICDNWGDEAVRNPNRALKGAASHKEINNMMLNGHTVHWLLGPVRFDSLDELKDELVKIASDPTRMVPDKEEGGKKVMPIVIEPAPKTVYGDVATTVDIVSAAGFKEINFGGGLGAKN